MNYRIFRRSATFTAIVIVIITLLLLVPLFALAQQPNADSLGLSLSPISESQNAEKDGTIKDNDEASRLTPEASTNGSTQETVIAYEQPTREEDGWRRLGESESVPRGSHVRLNMTSGEKWVKENIQQKEAPKSEVKTEQTPGERILEVLSGVPDEALTILINQVRNLGAPGSDDFESGARDIWEQRQTSLRAHKNETDAADFDGEVVGTDSRLAAICKILDTPQRVTEELLLELEEIVEELDEAHTFANDRHQGIRKCLDIIEHNDTSVDVKSRAASVVGKAIKNTNELQNATVALGGFEKLFRAFRNGLLVEAKGIYSLGSLLRGSKEAAEEALKHPEFFRELVSRLYSTTTNKVRERVAALTGDLLMEPGRWCWKSFQQAGLCHSSVDFTPVEREGNQHYEYLHGMRMQVCAAREEL